ncbi:MAG: pilus assembly protein CpaB [Solirubrobacteraceae bacterium]|jgi:pilus assembly protein CpaB|nr:pilus assembly protein CpaB [Solirubrobacteraceae bacterium]
MSRRRRGVLLIGLALVLGGLAAGDVGRREAALHRRLAPMVGVVVAGADMHAGDTVAPGDLAVREIPQRWAPEGAASAPGEVAGATVAVDLPAGAYVTTMDLVAASAASGPVGAGERAVEIVATGTTDLVAPGARVDVLVTREGAGTRLALQDVEVLDARDAPSAAQGGADRVTATLRVTLRQAVYLTAAESFASDLRLLPRTPGDDRRAPAVAFGTGLR